MAQQRLGLGPAISDEATCRGQSRRLPHWGASSPGVGTVGHGGPIPPLRNRAFPTGRALDALAAKGWASHRRTSAAQAQGRGDAGTWGQSPGWWQEALARSWHPSRLRGLFIASVESPVCTECSDLTFNNVINNN